VYSQPQLHSFTHHSVDSDCFVSSALGANLTIQNLPNELVVDSTFSYRFDRRMAQTLLETMSY